MSAVLKTHSLLSFPNPLNVFHAPSYIYEAVAGAFSALNHYYKVQLPPLDEGRVAPMAPSPESAAGADEAKEGGAASALDASLVLGHGVLTPDTYPSFEALLDQSSHPYPLTQFDLNDGTKLEITRTFLSDIERIGDPDQFFINGEEISPAPKTDAQKKALLNKLLHIAKGNPNTVKRWTEIWNYRIKVDLVNTMMEEFRSQFKLNPMIARRGGFSEVVISLDTERQILTCRIQGKVSHATNEDTDIVDVNIPFQALFTFDIKRNSVEKQIEFQIAK